MIALWSWTVAKVSDVAHGPYVEVYEWSKCIFIDWFYEV